MIDWGTALIKELAARRCIVFFGSGASAGCVASVGDTRPPTWEQLLTMLCESIRNNQSDQDIARQLIRERKYLDAAEVIVSSLIRADYVDTMRNIFEIPRYNKSALHESILRLDPKVVITTNFDTVYDLYCRSGDAAEGYNIFNYTDTHLISQLRSPIRCVIKAHGCITDPDTMILTRSEFFEARQRAPHFFRILDSLFLTHTLLFVGYSLSDPDIQITLENSYIAAPSSHTHYFVTEAGMHPALKKSAQRTYNISFLEFESGNYAELEASLADLADRVVEYRHENADV